MSITVEVTELVQDQGSIVVFQGWTLEPAFITPEGEPGYLNFAVDHRLAGPLAEAVEAEECPVVDIESWQVV